ncbi:histone deacetylase HDT1 [Brassica napus]|uniref:histone deacetylase HDT1 n=1 Tax=Brassica napus TaxID=3708 RepID=UPI0006AA8624|nr:histone deacetylase HDT1 [Brassica napus]
MEFWGVEVQAGKPLKVTPGYDSIVHISHASLGDCKGKKGEAVTLNVKVGDKKFVMGTLVSESIPQTCFDMLFDQEFELSHNWGKGSVHFVGFKCPNNKDDEGGEDFSDSEEEEEVEVPVPVAANGNAAKAVAKPKPVTAPDDSDSEGMDEDCSDDEDDSEEEEETPKAETRRKRAREAAPAPKTPVSAKKAKAAEATPKKTEEKKKGGPATPHPAKKGGNTPATATQSPKSASQVSCGSCKKTFNSSNALESHTKAKHSATAK